MSLMSIIKNLQSVPNIPPHVVHPALSLNLGKAPYNRHEIACLQSQVNRLELTQAEFTWWYPVEAEDVKASIYGLLENTYIRHVEIEIPSDLPGEDLNALNEGVDAVKLLDDLNRERYLSQNPGATYSSFEIRFRYLGISAENIFKNLLSDLENDKLKTNTIAVPTKRFCLTEKYDFKNLQEDLARLINSGKFEKFSLNWDEGKELSRDINERLISWFKMFWDARGNIKHYEINAPRIASLAHAKVIQAHVDNLRAATSSIHNAPTIALRGLTSEYFSNILLSRTRFFAGKKSDPKLKRKEYLKRKEKFDEIRYSKSKPKVKVHGLFSSLHQDQLTTHDSKDTLFTTSVEEQAVRKPRRSRASTN